MAETARPANILTIDVEDWCQSSTDLLDPGEGQERPIPPTRRVLTLTRRLLRLLAAHDARATCFVLGTVAEAFPELVREIRQAGHEVATHGYGHDPVYRLGRDDFAADLERSLTILEGITGEKVLGYRAPYFSVTSSARWALEVLGERGLRYDSSTFPVHRGLYGFYPGWEGGGAERYPHRIPLAGGRSLIELPGSTVRRGGVNLPIGGGGLLRLVPYRYLRWAIRQLNRAGVPAVFYLHPHDLDAEELSGRRPGDRWKQRALRWLLNLNRSGNQGKLELMLSEFRFTSVKEWLAATERDSFPADSARAVSAG